MQASDTDEAFGRIVFEYLQEAKATNLHGYSGDKDSLKKQDNDVPPNLIYKERSKEYDLC